MSEITTAFVGLDVHKESVAIAVAQADRAAPRFIGTTGPRISEIEKALSHLGPRADTIKPRQARQREKTPRAT